MVTTKCPITGQGSARTFTCSMRLGSGRWVLTTQARDGATVIASSVRRVVVKGTTRTAVTG
jgi:nitrogen fixation protein FixH